MSDEPQSILEKMDAGLLDLENPNEIPEEIQVIYRSVFKGSFGIDVLTDILHRLHFMEPLDGSAESVAKHNLSINLLANIGVLKPSISGRLELENVKKIVNSLLKGAIDG